MISWPMIDGPDCWASEIARKARSPGSCSSHNCSVFLFLFFQNNYVHVAWAHGTLGTAGCGTLSFTRNGTRDRTVLFRTHLLHPQSWHRATPNAGLVDHYDRFLGPTNAQSPSKAGAPKHRVLVPLCGKSVDIPFLADKGEFCLLTT